MIWTGMLLALLLATSVAAAEPGPPVAGGYRSLFVLGDLNYSQTDFGLDDRFKALIATVRAAWNGRITLLRRRDTFVEYGFNAGAVQTIATGLTFRF
jgi:hypothetical protein